MSFLAGEMSDKLKVHLSWVDYPVIALYFVFVMVIGLYMKNRAGKSMKEYFLSGRNLTWWVLGTSMVATTFSASTPMLISGWCREFGIMKNWEWWVFLFGQMFTTFFFAKLWRRTLVYNDAGFIKLRYSGKEASFLRGFRALYMGFVMNLLVMGTGLVAGSKIGLILMGIPKEINGVANPDYELWRWIIAIVCGLTVLFYSALGGFKAVVITDFVQFILSLIGSICIAIFVCMQPEVGGLTGLVERVAPDKLEFFPRFGVKEACGMTVFMVIGLACVRWWAQIYGGAEPGGQSHVAQRMLSAKTEKDAVLGSLWFNFAHYVVRPLPWIIAGLGTLLIFPLESFPKQHEEIYIASIQFLPIGLKGLVVASLFAAFMSTMDTRMNLGASYFVNDFYKPFVAKNKSDKHYISVSRWITAAQLIASYSVLLIAKDISTLFFIYAGIGSGAGIVYILRFYWSRISAWSEIAAMSGAVIMLIYFRWGVCSSEAVFKSLSFEYMFISLYFVTAFWALVTIFTRAPSKEKLKEFYRKVRPAGPGWWKIARELEESEGIPKADSMLIPFVGWVFSCPMTFGYLFGLGHLLLGKPIHGIIWILIGMHCTVVTLWCVKRMTSGSDGETSDDGEESAEAAV